MKTGHFADNSRSVFFVAPGSLEIPNNRGGGIEQNIFFLTQYCFLSTIVFSPHRGEQRTLELERAQNSVLYSVFQALENYPPRSGSFFSMVLRSLRIAPFYLDACARILILSKKIGTVVVFDKFLGILPMFLARIIRKKTLYMEYSIWPWCYSSSYRSIVFWIHIAFWKVVIRLVSAITVNSPAIRKDMIAFGTPSSKVSIVPTGIETTCTNKKEKRKKERFVVLYLGRLVKERGADLLPSIISVVLKSRRDTLFRIVGGGPLFEPIRDFVREHRLEKSVELLDQKSRKEAIELMKQSDVAIFVSKNENYGSLALLECMSAGCPVIATDVGSTREIIVDRINGILVDPKPYSIAEAILDLSENNSLATMISHGGRLTAEEYHWEQVARKFTSVLRKVVSINEESSRS